MRTEHLILPNGREVSCSIESHDAGIERQAEVETIGRVYCFYTYKDLTEELTEEDIAFLTKQLYKF